MIFLRNFLADLVKLRLPVTATAVVTFLAATLEPFGVALSTEQATAILVFVGVVAEYVRTRAT